MNDKILKLLYKSFDAPLTKKESEKLQEALKKSAALREEKEKIIRLRKDLAKTPEVAFKPFFAERVLNNLKAQYRSDRKENFLQESLIAAFKPLAIAAIVVLFSLIFYNLRATKNYSLAGALGKEPVKLEQVVDPVYALNME